MIKQVCYRNNDVNLIQGHQELGDNKWDLCAEPVFGIFDIPRGARTIWLTAHKKPSVNRVKVRLYGHNGILVDDEWQFWFWETEKSILRLLKKHGTFYVSAEYENFI